MRGTQTEEQKPNIAYPLAGAFLGTCLGGPVGLLAGVKIGGIAAVSGMVFGRSKIF